MTDNDLDRRNALRAGLLGAGALAIAAAAARPALAQPAGSTTWQQIQERKQLRIGVAPSEPWFSKDQRTQEWSGIGWGVGVAMAKELNVTPVAVETSWGNAVAGLQANQFDLMFVLDATPVRAMAIDFPVQPMFYYALGLLVRDGITVKNWSDIDRQGLSVGTTLGSTGDIAMTALLKQAKVERFPTNDETTAAFQAGRVDAISFFHPALVMQQAKVKKGTVVIPEPFRPTTTSVGVRRETDKTWRDWVGLTIDYYYITRRPQKIYEDQLAGRGIDPVKAPAIMRELWGKA